jgi:hypothetical protein
MALIQKPNTTYKIQGHPAFIDADGLYAVVTQSNGNQVTREHHYEIGVFRNQEMRNTPGESPIAELIRGDLSGDDFDKWFGPDVIQPRVLFSVDISMQPVLDGGAPSPRQIPVELNQAFLDNGHPDISGSIIAGTSPIWGIFISKYENYVVISDPLVNSTKIDIWYQGSDQFRQAYLHALEQAEIDPATNEPLEDTDGNIILKLKDWESDE